MHQATSLRSRGIQWTIFSHLQDLDFADDIVILSSTPTHLQEKLDDLNTNAKRTGLIISKKKSKIMCVNWDINKVNVFHNSCLRRICNIFWPIKISNNDLYQRTGCTSIDLEIKKRRLRWLGYVLRMSPERMPKVALRWTPAGKRKRGRPKTTRRKTVETELSEMGLSWGEAQAIVKDKTRWKRDIVAALCATGGNKD